MASYAIMAAYKVAIYDNRFSNGIRVFEADALPAVDCKTRSVTFQEKGKSISLVLRKKSVIVINEL